MDENADARDDTLMVLLQEYSHFMKNNWNTLKLIWKKA